MSNTKTKPLGQLIDAVSSSINGEDFPPLFEENYSSRQVSRDATEKYGSVDFSADENSNNVHGYVD
jgi:hypothetical protein